MVVATKTRKQRGTKAFRPTGKTARTARRPVEVSVDIDVGKILKSMKDAQLECRDLRHAWKTVAVFRNGEGYRIRVLRCSRGCKVDARDTLGDDYERVKPRRYDYSRAVGYRVEGGIEPSDVRAESIKRVKVYTSERAMLADLNGGSR